jgi:hypothetical protein
MSKIRRLVLDVVVPSAVDVIHITQDLAELASVSGVSSFVNEFDKKVINIKIIVEGTDINYKSLEKTITAHGGAVHSVDSVAAGKQIIEDVETPQD